MNANLADYRAPVDADVEEIDVSALGLSGNRNRPTPPAMSLAYCASRIF